jgi:hypothetical protein
MNECSLEDKDTFSTYTIQAYGYACAGRQYVWFYGMMSSSMEKGKSESENEEKHNGFTQLRILSYHHKSDSWAWV